MRTLLLTLTVVCGYLSQPLLRAAESAEPIAADAYELFDRETVSASSHAGKPAGSIEAIVQARKFQEVGQER